MNTKKEKLCDQLTFAWLAGFLDGDGSISAQIVRKEDYKLKFQIRVLITFFQTSKRHYILLYIRKLLRCGTVRKRSDGMSELCIVSAKDIEKSLEKIQPYLRLKRKHARLALQIITNLPETKNPSTLLKVARLVDKFALLTDGKKRTITAKEVNSVLCDLGFLEG